MKRIFGAAAATVLVGCCTLFVSSYGGATVDVVTTSVGSVTARARVPAGGILDDSRPLENSDANVFQHPFLITPTDPETEQDSDMARTPASEQLPFQHPFSKKPHDAPEENSAAYVGGDSASLPSGGPDELAYLAD